MNMAFDFGTGRLTPVTHNDHQYVRFDGLVTFLDGNYDEMLAAARDSMLGDKLVTLPDGAILMPWELIPVSMFVWPTNAIGAAHRDGHTEWCRKVSETGAFRKLGEQIAADLGGKPSGEPHRPRHLSPAQRVELARHDVAIRDAAASAPKARETSDGELRTLHLDPKLLSSPENKEATALFVERTANAMKYIVAERLTHIAFASEMLNYVFAGGAFWIYRERAGHLAKEPDSFGAAVLEAAGFGAGAVAPPLEPELSDDQLGELGRREAELQHNLFGQTAPTGPEQVLEVMGAVLRDATRTATAVRQIELMAGLASYLDNEGIGPEHFKFITALAPLSNMVARVLSERDNLATRPDTFGHRVLSLAKLL